MLRPDNYAKDVPSSLYFIFFQNSVGLNPTIWLYRTKTCKMKAFAHHIIMNIDY